MISADNRSHRGRRQLVLSVLGSCLAIWAAACSRINQDLRVATGLVSHTVCSETFVSGLDPNQVYAESIKPRPGMSLINWAVRDDVDRARKEVTTTVAGAFESHAVYRNELGCLVVHGEEPADATLPKIVAAEDRPLVLLLPDIAGPATVKPANEGLRAALDRAFAEPDRPPYRWVKAIVVMHDGSVVAERYAPGYGIGTPLLGYSATKSVINALLGILVRQQRLSVEQPAPVAAWSDPSDPRHAITIDELERMTSGLALDETDSLASPVSRMLYVERDMAGFAERAPLEATPSSTWNYTSGNTLILSRIIRDMVGGHSSDVLNFARSELFDPLGMRNVTLEFDATGTPIGSTYMLASARDWARFGMLYLDDGVVGGRRILPEGWVRYSSSRTLDSMYAAGFWLGASQWRARWGIPDDTFFASGLLGQRVVVIPSRRLVIVRFGVTEDFPNFDIQGLGRLIADVIAAVSEKPR